MDSQNIEWFNFLIQYCYPVNKSLEWENKSICFLVVNDRSFYLSERYVLNYSDYNVA